MENEKVAWEMAVKMLFFCRLDGLPDAEAVTLMHWRYLFYLVLTGAVLCTMLLLLPH